MKPLFTLSGTVTKGKNRGKKMGFPTANFPADPKSPQGIFYSRTGIEEKIYNSITFVGTVETFDETDFVCETCILDFDREIYGKKIAVHFLEKIRENKKFESEEDLIKEIANDKKLAIDFFKRNN